MEKQIEENIERLILAGLGAIILTKEKTEKIVDELVEKGRVAKKKGPDLIETIVDKGKDVRKEIEKIVEKKVASIHKKLNLPTRTDLDELSKRIAILEKKIKKM